MCCLVMLTVNLSYDFVVFSFVFTDTICSMGNNTSGS